MYIYKANSYYHFINHGTSLSTYIKIRLDLFLFFCSSTFMLFTMVIVDLHHTSRFSISFFTLFIFDIFYDLYNLFDYFFLLQYFSFITDIWKKNLVLKVKYYHM